MTDPTPNGGGAPASKTSRRIKQRRAFLLIITVAVTAAVLALRPRATLTDADVASRLRQAEQSLERGDTDAARVHLTRVLDARPDHSQALLYLAQLLRDEGRDEDALAALRSLAPNDGGQAARARFLEAMILLDQHQARAAEQLLTESIELDPQFLLPRERLLQLLVLERRRSDVRSVLDALAEVRGPQLHELALRTTAGEPVISASEAIPQLEAFVASDADDVESRVALARYLIDGQHYERARRILHSPARDLRLCALQILVWLEDSAAQESAPSCFLESADATFSDTPLLFAEVISQYAMIQGDWELCIAAGLAVLQQDPLEQSACHRVGTGLRRIGRDSEAVVFLDRSAEIGRLRDLIEGIGILMIRRNLNAASLGEIATLLEKLGDGQQAEQWRTIADGRETVEMRPATPGAFHETVARLALEFDRPVTIDSLRGSQRVADSASLGLLEFQDVHEEVGLRFVYFNGQTGLKYLLESMGGGVAVVDFDRDSWPDLFFPQGSYLTNETPRTVEHRDRLFRNLGGKRFADLTTSAHVGDTAYSVGCAAADFDADGFQDLFVANYGRCSLFHNQGDGTFHEIGAEAGLTAESMSMGFGPGDFDLDGDLDLYVANYVDRLQVCRNDRGNISACNPAYATGVDDRLYENDGQGTLVLCGDAGLPPRGKGLGVVVADLNSDRLPDIYVANDTDPNFLMINQSRGGTLRFREQGLLSGCALDADGAAQAGMGIACGDVNGDLLPDLYVTNFYGEPNTLYFNEGAGNFFDRTRATGLYQPTMPMLGFGTQAVDFDLDRWLDLFVANGHIDDIEVSDEPWKMQPQVFRNLGEARFDDVSLAAGEYFREKMLGRGTAVCDWNQDGRPDLVVVHQDRETAVLENRTVTHARAISCRFVGRRSNRDGFGATLHVTVKGQPSFFELMAGNGFCASNEPLIHVGLGEADAADSIKVTWPSGGVEEFTAVPAGSRLTFVEGRGVITMPSP